MGLEQKAGAATATAEPTPDPMVGPISPTPTPTPTPAPTAAPPKAMGGTVAEGPDAPQPVGDPHIGMS